MKAKARSNIYVYYADFTIISMSASEQICLKFLVYAIRITYDIHEHSKSKSVPLVEFAEKFLFTLKCFIASTSTFVSCRAHLDLIHIMLPI